MDNKQETMTVLKLAVDTSRFEQALSFAKQLIQYNTPLNQQQILQICKAYKLAFSQRRAQLKLLKKCMKSSQLSPYVQIYEEKLSNELTQMVKQCSSNLQSLMKLSVTPKSQITVYKVAADVARYSIENQIQFPAAIVNFISSNYKKAYLTSKRCKMQMSVEGLSVILNYCKFQTEVLRNPGSALQKINTIWQSGIVNYNQLNSKGQYLQILQLISDMRINLINRMR